MKKSLKVAIAGILAGSTALLVGCGGSSSGGGNSLAHIDTPWWTTTGTLNKNGDEIVFNNVTLNLTTVVAGADLTPFKDMVTKFNQEHTGKITVTVDSVNEEEYLSTIANRIQIGINPPELLMTHSKLQKSLADKENIQPIDEVIAATGYEMDWNNYSEAFAKDVNLGYDNATFIVPVDMQSQIVLYNKDILNALGYGVPTSRAEFLEVCEAYKNSSYAGKAVLMPTQGGHFTQYIYPTAYVQNGGELYNEETNRMEWTSASNLQAFNDANESILSLVNAGYMTYGLQEKDVLPDFYENKGLFLFIPPWQVSPSGGVFNSYAEANGIDKDAPNFMSQICSKIGGMSTAGLFAMDETRETANNIYVDSHSFSIASSVKDVNKKAACLYFIKWFTENAEVATEWAKYGHNSCNIKVLNSQEYQESVFVQQIAKHYYDANSITTIGCNPYGSHVAAYLKGVSAIILKSPDSTASKIQEVQDEYNRLLADDEDY